MSAKLRFRDAFRSYVPRFLADRAGKNVGFRFLWVMIASLDVAAQALVEGIQAAQPGIGTPSALARIGRTRGIQRGIIDTDETYSERLRKAIDTWREAGSAYELARQIRAYLGTSPRVRVITRSGIWVTIDTDGTETVQQAVWDWDSLSHPERAGFWSEMWVVVYGAHYTVQPTWGSGRKWGDRREGLGHQFPSEQSRDLRTILRTWKSAHSYIRAVIWTNDNTQFNPIDTFSCPNGQWGSWGIPSIDGDPTSTRVRSPRFTNCRYWEF